MFKDLYTETITNTLENKSVNSKQLRTIEI